MTLSERIKMYETDSKAILEIHRDEPNDKNLEILHPEDFKKL